MNGPTHFTEGERRLKASDLLAAEGKTRESTREAVTALTHFVAALVTLAAADVQGDSISWGKATDR